MSTGLCVAVICKPALMLSLVTTWLLLNTRSRLKSKKKITRLICVSIIVFHAVFFDSLRPSRFFSSSHTVPVLPVAMPAQLGEMGSTWLRINPCLSPGSIRQKQQRQIIHSVLGKEWQKSPRSCLDRCLLRKALMVKRTQWTKGRPVSFSCEKGRGTTEEGCTLIYIFQVWT